MSIKFPVTIKILYEKEAKDAPYVAYIPEFDISSCAKTEEKAKENVKEALEITLEEVNKKHQLEEFLKEAGISIKKQSFFQELVSNRLLSKHNAFNKTCSLQRSHKSI